MKNCHHLRNYLKLPRRFMTIILVTCLFILSNRSLLSQEYSYKHYTVQDGLLQMQVMRLFQDSKGYLWVGTKLGVSRFDGHTFKNITLHDGLPETYIFDIKEDQRGNIWFLTRSGIAFWDGQKLKAYPTDIFLDGHGVFEIIAHSPDSLSIFHANKDNQLVESQFFGETYKTIRTYFPENKNISNLDQLQTAYDIKNKILWAASAKFGLHKIQNGIKTKITDKFENVQSLKRGKDGHIYLFAENQFYRIESDSLVNLKVNLAKNSTVPIFPFEIDPKGTIYYRNDYHSRLNIIEGKEVFQESRNLNFINVLLSDSENNLWIGTEAGLYRMAQRSFLNFIPKEGGMNENIWSVVEDKYNRMFFTSFNNGMQYYEKGKFITENTWQEVTKKKDVNFYMGSLKASDGNTYFTVTHKTLIKFDGTKFIRTVSDTISIVAFIVYEDPDTKHILFGANPGLFKLNSNNSYEYRLIRPGNGKSNGITGITKDSLNRYWLGGFNGMSLLDGENIIHLPTDSMPFEFGGNAMLRDSADNLWIGNPHGLFHYNYKNFKKIESTHLNTLVTALALVGDSTLLIGTLNGLLMMDLKSFYQNGTTDIVSIGPDKGYFGIEPGQNGFFRDSKGFYWLTNSDRVVRIDPRLLKKNPHPPKVYINSVSLLDDKMRWNAADAERMKDARFFYADGEKNLRFEYTGISLRHPEGVTYSHFLEGYDKGWSEPDKERTAVYTNLPPGKYKLLVKAANTDGIWSTETAALSFEIVPALHQRLWFRIFGILLGASILMMAGGLFNNFRRRKHRTMLENDKRMAQLQLLNLKNQIDPHFTYNAISSIASVVLKEEKEIAYKYFVKLSRLMRGIISSSDRLTRSLEEEMNFVTDYLDIQKFRFKELFDFEIHVAPDVNLNSLIPKMSIQTFTENSIRHGLQPKTTNGNLQIRIKQHNGNLRIEIEDNGIGREKAKYLNTQNTGKGIYILQGYFDHFNHFNQKKIHWEIIDLYTENGIARGTLVVMEIPEGYEFNI